MNFSLLNVVVFGAGAILVYAAIKNKNPKDVINQALSSQTQAPKGNAPATTPKTVPAVYQTTFPVTSV